MSHSYYISDVVQIMHARERNVSLPIQAHFEANQFEANRADGRKLLRPDAIPTIFCHLPPPRHRKPPCKRGPEESPRTVSRLKSLKRIRMEHSYNAALSNGNTHPTMISDEGTS